MSNKRQAPRVRKRFRVDLAGTPLFTIDVSEGGFCAEAMRVLQPGSPIRGFIRIRDQEMPFVGTVAWARAGEPRMQLRGRMGVRFTEVGEESQLLKTELAGPTGR